MCFEKHDFVAICIVQTVKLINTTLFVDCNDISNAQNLADYAMLAFQAKLVLTGGIYMYESGSWHHVIYERRMVSWITYLASVHVARLSQWYYCIASSSQI
jgi:hypothetical protein